MVCGVHRGLLQPDQHVVRHDHRVLLPVNVPPDDCHARIRVSLAGPSAQKRQAAGVHERPGIRGGPHGVDPGVPGRRNHIPDKNGRSVSQAVPCLGENHHEAFVPGVCPHVLPPFRRDQRARAPGPHEHQSQALCDVLQRIRYPIQKGLRSFG